MRVRVLEEDRGGVEFHFKFSKKVGVGVGKSIRFLTF
jgi:hypothetical protein